MTTRIAIVFLFVAMWAGVTGSLTVPNLLFGLLLGLAALWLVREEDRDRGTIRLVPTLRLGWLFVVELLKSGWRVAKIAVRPTLNLRPAVIAYPLGLTRDFEIAILANLITLTPGTLSVDVSGDRRTLYIHCVDVDDTEAVVADIRQGFEARIREAFP
jgi:multicomponent Na+:H+ antiporter subunit E